MQEYETKKIIKKDSEKSFSLIETVIAIGLLATLLLEVTAISGRSVTFSDYQKNSSHAIWIAKSIISELEYRWRHYDLSEIKISIQGSKVPNAYCNKEVNVDCYYTYNFSVKEWKLPIINLLLGSNSQNSSMMQEMLKKQIKSILGDNLLKVAHVEVFWPEGAKRNSVDLTYLITGVNKLNSKIALMGPISSWSDHTSTTKDKKTCPVGQKMSKEKCVPVDSETKSNAPEDDSM